MEILAIVLAGIIGSIVVSVSLRRTQVKVTERTHARDVDMGGGKPRKAK